MSPSYFGFSSFPEGTSCPGLILALVNSKISVLLMACLLIVDLDGVRTTD